MEKNKQKSRDARLGKSRVVEMPKIMPDFEGRDTSNVEMNLSEIDEWDSIDEWGFDT